MRREEARTIARWVARLGLPSGAICLNIGSSTREFRTRIQPHIDEFMSQPIEEQGIRLVHCDLKQADGVDEVGDVLDPAFQQKLRRYQADIIICSNLLEHLTDPSRFASACGSLVRPGGYGLFTVPQSYPYHPDPIDTMLRLTPQELAALLPDWEVVKAEQLVDGNYLSDLRRKPNPIGRLTRQFGRAIMPFYRPTKWKANAHPLLWLFRPFRQSMVLLRKPLDGSAAAG